MQGSSAKFVYVTYACDCQKKFEPIKNSIMELKTYFCFKCMKQLAQEFSY